MRSTISLAVATFLFACAGPVGPAGEQGPMGADGKNGVDGRDGIDGQDGKDGADGDDGKDGQNGKCSLLVMSDDPASASCPLGGVKVQSVMDADCNPNTKDDQMPYDEPKYLCNYAGSAGSCTTLHGSYTIVNSLDVETLENAGCTTIDGDLNVTPGGGGLDGLTGLTKLTTITGRLVVTSSALKSVSFPALQAVGGLLRVSSNTYLETLDFPALQSAGGIEIDGAQALTMLNLGVLTNVTGGDGYGDLRFWNMPQINAINLPAVQTVSGNLTVGGGMPNITSLRVDSLTTLGKGLSVSNTNLSELSLFALRSVGSYISVRDNPQLPQCQVDAIHANNPTAAYETSGNDVSATCP